MLYLEPEPLSHLHAVVTIATVFILHVFHFLSFFVHVQRYQGTCVEGREQPVGVASYLPLKAHFSLGHQLIDFLLIMEAQSIA